VSGVPISIVLLERHAAAEHVLAQHERPVAHEVLRSHPVIAILRDSRFIDRIHILLRQQIEQIGGRTVQPHSERVTIERLDAERVGGFLASGDLQCVINRRKSLRILRAGCGIDHATPRVHEIACRQRCAVGPARVGPQMKYPGLTVGAALPGGRDAGRRLASDVNGGESFEQVVEDALARHIGGQLRIDRSRRVVQGA